MAELKSVVFDLSQDRLAYWGNVTGITFNNSELRKAWIRAQGYIRSQVVDPLMRDQSWQSYKWQGWIIEAKKPSGIEWRLGELSDIKLPTQRSCVYVPTDVCSITASRETWRTHFNQAHLKYVVGSDLLATDVPPFANYFYLLQCFIPGIFTIPAWSQEGSIALPSSRWVEANEGALRRIFGEIKLRALQNAVAQRRGNFVPSKSEPAPLPQVASALSYQVIFDLNNPALDRWKTDTQLGWDDSQMSQAWKRAKQTFIPNNILQPLRTQWTDLTGNNRADIMATFQYVAQPSRELYVPSCTQFPRRARMRWKQRFESAGIQPSNTPSLELNNSIPPLANFFYLLQCFIPGIFVIAGSDGRKAFLPPAKWVAGQRAALVQIFGQPTYQQLKDASTSMRIFSAPAPNPASAPPIPTQKAKKPKKQKTQRSSGGS